MANKELMQVINKFIESPTYTMMQDQTCRVLPPIQSTNSLFSPRKLNYHSTMTSQRKMSMMTPSDVETVKAHIKQLTLHRKPSGLQSSSKLQIFESPPRYSKFMSNQQSFERNDSVASTQFKKPKPTLQDIQLTRLEQTQQLSKLEQQLSSGPWRKQKTSVVAIAESPKKQKASVSFSKAFEILKPEITTEQEKHLQLMRKHYVNPTYEYELKAMDRLYDQIQRRVVLHKFSDEAIRILSTHRRSVSLQHMITQKTSGKVYKEEESHEK